MADRVLLKTEGGQNGLRSASPTGAAKCNVGTVTPSKTGVPEPPPDVRCIVDKTAEFVVQNGLEFEQKILSNEKRNPRFNFLKSKDAYHSYYQQRILEFIDLRQSPQKPAKQGATENGK